MHFRFNIFLVILFIITACQSESSQLAEDDQANPVTTIQYPDGAIPFTFDRHLIFDGYFDDSIPARWVYDTGCPMPIFDSTFLKKSGVSFENYQKSVSFGAGNHMTPTYILDEIHSRSVDTLREELNRIIALDLCKAIGEKRADGILDVKFFGDEIIEFNYQDEYVLIHPPEYVPDSSWTSIPFVYESDRIILEDLWVAIEPGKRISGPFLLDLGAGGTFILASHAAQQQQLMQTEKDLSIMDLSHGGIGGESTIGLLTADQCGIASFEFDEVPVVFSTNTRGAFGNTSHNGVVGNRLLSRFHMIIDLVNNQLHLKPNDSYEEEFKEPGNLGFSVLDRTISEGAFVVNGLVRNALADSIGLKRGDLIVAYDQTAISDTSYVRPFLQRLDSLHQIQTIVLKIKRDGQLLELEWPGLE